MSAQLPAVMVTGANGGIGTALTRALIDAGYTVYAGVRDVDQARAALAPEARLVRLDVTDPAGVEAAAADVARQQHGAGLHALVNNAGIIVQGPLELSSADDLRHQFDVNVVGAMTVTNAFLPLLRQGAPGRIVNVSAATARTAVPFMGPISSSKAALESLSDALRIELAPWGIRVVIVEPGATDTAIFAKAQARSNQAMAATADDKVALYEPSLAALGKAMAKTKLHPVDRVTRVIVKAVGARNPKPRYVSGSDARNLVLLSHLPSRARDRLLTGTLGLKKV